MHWKLVDYYSHKDRAGLQLSDVVASSFYYAADNLDTGPCDPRFAGLLRPRIAFRGTYNYADYGVVLQPTPDWKADISEPQRGIFRDFGYTFKKVVGPGPVSSAGLGYHPMDNRLRIRAYGIERTQPGPRVIGVPTDI